MLSNELYALFHLILRSLLCPAQNDSARALNLVIIEFAKVLHVHLALGDIGNRYTAAQLHFRHLIRDSVYCLHNIGQLAYSGRLDQNPIRRILAQNFLQRLGKISYQRTADTAGIHLCNLNPRLLQKSSVDSDLAEFIFNQYDLFSLQAVL